MNRNIGYFIWSGQIIRTSRYVLSKKINQGEVSLKAIELQARALIAHHLIYALCSGSLTLSYDPLTLSIRKLNEILPIDICQIQGPMKIFANVIEFTYAVAGNIPYEEFSLKDFYRVFSQSCSFQPSNEIRYGPIK